MNSRDSKTLNKSVSYPEGIKTTPNKRKMSAASKKTEDPSFSSSSSKKPANSNLKGNSSPVEPPVPIWDTDSIQIHSGQFMATKIHEADPEIDSDAEIDVIGSDSESEKTNEEAKLILSAPQPSLRKRSSSLSGDKPLPKENDGMEKPVTFYKFGPKQTRSIAIDVSLGKLNKCLNFAYSKLTTPKWKKFAGLKLSWKERIRLNNVIWRSWHMEFKGNQRPKFCAFSLPSDERHNCSEGVVLEGMYWKRRRDAVCAQYKRWRLNILRRLSRNNHPQQPKITGTEDANELIFKPTESEDTWVPLPQRSQSRNLQPGGATCSHSLMNAVTFEEDDYNNYFTDRLFESLKETSYMFPNPKEMAQAKNSDFIQPSLIQLQPSLEDIMASLDATYPIYGDDAEFGSSDEVNIKTIESELKDSYVPVVQSTSTSQGQQNIPAHPNRLVSQQSEPCQLIRPSSAEATLSTESKFPGKYQHQSMDAILPPNQSSVPGYTEQDYREAELLIGAAENLHTTKHIQSLARAGRSDPNLGQIRYQPLPFTPFTTTLLPNSCQATYSQAVYDNSSASLLLHGGGNGQQIVDPRGFEMDSYVPQMAMLTTQGLSGSNTPTFASKVWSPTQSHLTSARPPSKGSLKIFDSESAGVAYNDKLVLPLKKQRNPRKRTSTVVSKSTNKKSKREARSSDFGHSAVPSLTGHPFGPPDLQDRIPMNSHGHGKISHSTPIIMTTTPLQIPTAGFSSEIDKKLNIVNPEDTVTQQGLGTGVTKSGMSSGQVFRPSPIGPPSAFFPFSPRMNSSNMTAGFSPPGPSPSSGRLSSASSSTNQSGISVEQLRSPLTPSTPSTLLPQHFSTTNTSLSQELLTSGGLQQQQGHQQSLLIVQPGNNLPIMSVMSTPDSRLSNLSHSPTTIPSVSIKQEVSDNKIAMQPYQVSDYPLDNNPSSSVSSHSKRKSTKRAAADSTVDPLERKRMQHLYAEQSRRSALKGGFELIEELLPDSTLAAGTKNTNAVVLARAGDYVKKLQRDVDSMRREKKTSIEKVARLQEKIKAHQSHLPVVGGVASSGDHVIQSQYNRYVKEKTTKNWKFWLLNNLMKPLFETYCQEVTGKNKQELQSSAKKWAINKCQAINLRPIASQTLVDLATQTPVMSEPQVMASWVKDKISKS